MYLIGDVHGKFTKYGRIINQLPASIQLGDMGLGFGKDDKFPLMEGHYFIRGNHDNPFVCRNQLSYLGEYGKMDPGYFFVSGGYSIDQHTRTEGVSWWREEELNTTQQNQAFIEYLKAKPKFMFTHECPGVVLNTVLNFNKSGKTRNGTKSSTARMLDAMFSDHKPEVWIFAHHHKDIEFDYGGTHFVCCGECSVYDIVEQTFVDV